MIVRDTVTTAASTRHKGLVMAAATVEEDTQHTVCAQCVISMYGENDKNL